MEDRPAETEGGRGPGSEPTEASSMEAQDGSTTIGSRESTAQTSRLATCRPCWPTPPAHTCSGGRAGGSRSSHQPERRRQAHRASFLPPHQGGGSHVGKAGVRAALAPRAESDPAHPGEFESERPVRESGPLQGSGPASTASQMRLVLVPTPHTPWEDVEGVGEEGPAARGVGCGLR